MKFGIPRVTGLTGTVLYRLYVVYLNPVKSYYEDKEATYKISLGDDLADFIEKIKSIDNRSGLAFKALNMKKHQGSIDRKFGPL